jgi:hypothetical protein
MFLGDCRRRRVRGRWLNGRAAFQARRRFCSPFESRLDDEGRRTEMRSTYVALPSGHSREAGGVRSLLVFFVNHVKSVKTTMARKAKKNSFATKCSRRDIRSAPTGSSGLSVF